MIKYVKKITNPVSINHVDINWDFNIKYIGQSGTSGYACAAKGYIANYVLKGVPISWYPLFFDDSCNDKKYYVDVLSESVINREYKKYKKLIIHSTPDIWHKYIDNTIDYNIGYCTWETNLLPKKWVCEINKIDEIWVPSEFNKRCFIESGVKSKIVVVPHIWHPQSIFDKNYVSVYDYTRQSIPSNKYTFYSIGEFNYRKGIEDLITVFDRFNDKYHDTQLVLKLHYKNYDINGRTHCIKKINSLTNKLGKSIYLILDNLNRDEIIGLHSFGDCYVSLNKGEGFGLTIFDAYNFGKRIITTGYGGQLDYLTKHHMGLVDFKLNKVSGMEKFSTNYTDEQYWAYPNQEHAYELMEKFYEQSR